MNRGLWHESVSAAWSTVTCNRAQQNEAFRNCLIEFVESITQEIFPNALVDRWSIYRRLWFSSPDQSLDVGECVRRRNEARGLFTLPWPLPTNIQPRQRYQPRQRCHSATLPTLPSLPTPATPSTSSTPPTPTTLPAMSTLSNYASPMLCNSSVIDYLNMRNEGGLAKGLVKLRLPVWVKISGDACVDACGNLYLNQYFHSRQIKLYSLNSTNLITSQSCQPTNESRRLG